MRKLAPFPGLQAAAAAAQRLSSNGHVTSDPLRFLRRSDCACVGNTGRHPSVLGLHFPEPFDDAMFRLSVINLSVINVAMPVRRSS